MQHLGPHLDAFPNLPSVTQSGQAHVRGALKGWKGAGAASDGFRGWGRGRLLRAWAGDRAKLTGHEVETPFGVRVPRG